MERLFRIHPMVTMVAAWALASPAAANYVLFSDYTLATAIATEIDVGFAGTSPTLTIVRGGVASSGGASDFAVQSFNSSTVNVVEGGRVDGGIGARDSSSIVLGDGSTVGGVKAYDTSHVTVASNAEFGQIFGYDSAQITVNGGILGGEVVAAGHSTATINDGADLGFAGAAENGQVIMNGGNVGGISAASNGDGEPQFTLLGGTVQGNAITGDGGTLTIADGDILGNLLAWGGSAFMLGGRVGGSVDLSSEGGPEVFLADGEVVGNAVALSGVLRLTGSTIEGSVVASGVSEVDMSGGTVDGSVIANGASTIIIAGGTILGNLIENGGTIVHISGGQIDDPSTLGWYVNDTSLLDIDGFGLADTLLNPRFYGFLDPNFADSPFPYNQYSEYRLSGILLDGTSVDGTLLFVQNDTGARFDLINEPTGPGGGGTAPEPGSIALVALGGALLGTVRRYVAGTASVTHLPRPQVRLDLDETTPSGATIAGAE
jgi:hypothetical protein